MCHLQSHLFIDLVSAGQSTTNTTSTSSPTLCSSLSSDRQTSHDMSRWFRLGWRLTTLITRFRMSRFSLWLRVIWTRARFRWFTVWGFISTSTFMRLSAAWCRPFHACNCSSCVMWCSMTIAMLCADGVVDIRGVSSRALY